MAGGRRGPGATVLVVKPALVLFPAIVFAQSLSNWSVPPVLKALGYSSELRHDGCHSTACVVLAAPASPPAGAFGNLTQTFDAAPYRGHAVRLHAWIRLEPADPSDVAPTWARMWLDVSLPAQGAGSSSGVSGGFSDNMGDRPISSTEWKSYEILGEVAPGAASVSVGAMLFGKGRAWVDGVTFEILPDAPASLRETFQKLYARIDAAYEQRDLDALASLALPGARILMGSTSIPLTSALVQIMDDVEQGSKYGSRSTVTSVSSRGTEATVYVNNQSTLTSKAGRRILISTNRDTWVRAGDAWKLKESSLISARPVTPPTDPASAEQTVAELKQRAVPLAAADDLAPFGNAVGDARIVALGEATHGMREFVQIKQRLLEYLVGEKGFTVLAVEANWPEALAVDRYIKTGEGDPKAALAGMYGWRWYTQEMLELVEWMRHYNQAPGGHANLTFTSFDMQVARAAAQKVLDYLEHCSPGDAGEAGAAYEEARALDLRRDQVYDDRAESAASQAAKPIQVLDSKRAELVRQSSPEAWRDARQAAAIVYQASMMRAPGKGPAYRDEMMAAHIEWLATDVHPGEKMVIWSDNEHVRSAAAADSPKSMGAWLREPYGSRMYAVGFAFKEGHLRAAGMEGGKLTGLAEHNAAGAEGSGDSILGLAGMPCFFLNLAAVPAGGPLGRWLAQPHLFHNAGAEWVTGDPEANRETAVLPKLYDGLIFVDEGHPTHALEPRP